MLGAIAGDIIGSVHEFTRNADPDFALFAEASAPTDDSLLTCAVAAALMEGRGRYREHLLAAYEEANRARPAPPTGPGWGTGFADWASEGGPPGRMSYGNGAAMRVSAIGWLLDDPGEILREAERSALPSHAHPEGIRGARCVAACVSVARRARDAEAVREAARGFYDRLPSIESIRRDHRYNETCQGCVPEAVAIACAMPDYESAVRLACSVRGDADTLAAIAGSVAEGLHGVPAAIAGEARARLGRWYPDAALRLSAALARMGR